MRFAIGALLHRWPRRTADPVEHPAATATPATRLHVVRPGETLDAIAERYRLSALSLRIHNGLRWRDEPRAGVTLRIVPETRGEEPTTPIDDALRHHLVTPNETAAQLCDHYGIALCVLLRANGLASAASITPGSVLTIPTSTDPADTGELALVRAGVSHAA